jgi:predicted Fe-Mo cluster-binding NifX family protein
MKVALSTTKPEFETSLEPRFGRCAYFVIVDTETRAWEAIANPAAEAMGGAGTQAAQFLSEKGIDAVITGNYGPNAFLGLQAAEIRMYRAAGGTLSELVDALVEDRLESVSGATGPARHGGRG